MALLTQKGMTEDSPVLVRIFKAESELEIWKAKDDGRFYLFKTYPICDWSGTLGPKVNQGDRQAPEGFYLVSSAQMNPKSKYHLAFNIGFPNAYDRSNGWTGADIMVHGDCKSAGCYAMTDGVVEEIYILAREALAGGQPAFQVQAYPFRMTAANMAKHKSDQWYGFWRNLKEGYDYFEVTHQPPRIEVCDKHYLVNAAFVDRGARPDPTGACPAYEKLPVEPAPRGPVLQQASAKPGAKQASADADITNSITDGLHRQAARQLVRPDLWTAEADLSGLHARPGDAGQCGTACRQTGHCQACGRQAGQSKAASPAGRGPGLGKL